MGNSRGQFGWIGAKKVAGRHVTKGAVRALTLDETKAVQLVAGEARSVHPEFLNELVYIAKNHPKGQIIIKFAKRKILIL